MKLGADRQIKLLFHRILLCVVLFVLIAMVLYFFPLKQKDSYLFFSALGMALGIVMSCYCYVKEQIRIIEEATLQITAYLAGDEDIRIACDQEGALYRFFQKVNTLASTLHAHAEKERETKTFLKNTISDISHQLKTPLAALNLYNGIIQDEGEALPNILEFTRLSEQELDRIETLIQNLLKITKLDAAVITFDKKWEDVSEIMEEVEKHFAVRAKQEGKELEFIGDKISFFCDRNWLIEAIDNIVKNGLDHTQKGEYVRIKWELMASTIRITIQDNGSGIHPEDIFYLFKRFYRSRFSQDTQGLGLGLSLAKSIIEAHKGNIEVNSELGIGTTFTIYLMIH
jgi:signal transduction histidine kinase